MPPRLSILTSAVCCFMWAACVASAAYLQRTCSNTLEAAAVDVAFAAADTGSFVSKGCTYAVSLTLSGTNSGVSLLSTVIVVQDSQFTSATGPVFVCANSLVLGEGSSLTIRNFTARGSSTSQLNVNGGLSHASAFIAIVNSVTPFAMMLAGTYARGARISVANVTQLGAGWIQLAPATCTGCIATVSDSDFRGTFAVSASNNPETATFSITRLISTTTSVSASKMNMTVLDSRFGQATINTGSDVAYTLARINATSLSFRGVTFSRAVLSLQRCLINSDGIALYVGVGFVDSTFTLLDSEMVTSGTGISSLSFSVSTTRTRVRIANNKIASLVVSRAMSFSINSGDSVSDFVLSNNTFGTIPRYATVMAILVRYGALTYDGLNRVVSAEAGEVSMEVWDMSVPQRISIANQTISSLRLGHLTSAIGTQQRGLSLSIVDTVVTGAVLLDFSYGTSLEADIRIDGLRAKDFSLRLSPNVTNSTILLRNANLTTGASFPAATTVSGSCVGFVGNTFPGLSLRGMSIGTESTFSFRNNAFIQPSLSLAALWVSLAAGGRLQLDRSNALIGGSSLNVTCVGGGAGAGWCPLPSQYGVLLLAPRHRGPLCGGETVTTSVSATLSASVSLSAPNPSTTHSSGTTRSATVPDLSTYPPRPSFSAPSNLSVALVLTVCAFILSSLMFVR